MDSELATSILRRFDDLGLKILGIPDLERVSTHDAVAVTISHEYGHGDFFLGYSDTLTATAQRWKDGLRNGKRKLLLVGPRITERSAEIFRLQDINYVDQAGNAYIDFAGVYIDIRGRRALSTSSPRSTHFKRGGINLFSLKRSQIIFSLLSWPELLHGPIRHLANSAGTSIGQTQETLQLLTQYDFLDRQRVMSPYQRETLIDQWAASYPTGLGSQARTTLFSGDWNNLDSSNQKIYVSGEPSTQYLAHPETVVLYTEDPPTGLVRLHRWRRDDDNPNIFVRHQFWTAPDEPEGPGVYPAPLLLTYADLLASNDSRQREAAIQLRSAHL